MPLLFQWYFFLQKYESNFVPMDFRGSTGRVIQDPTEIAMMEKEREISWRRRLYMRNGNMRKQFHLFLIQAFCKIKQECHLTFNSLAAIKATAMS